MARAAIIAVPVNIIAVTGTTVTDAVSAASVITAVTDDVTAVNSVTDVVAAVNAIHTAGNTADVAVTTAVALSSIAAVATPVN